MNVEFALSMFEDMRVLMCDEDIQQTANIQVMKSLRHGLLEAGMSRSYADQLVATATVDVNEGVVNEEQLARLLVTTRGIAYQFHRIFNEAGFNDQAIALMGSQLSIKLTG